MLGHVLRGFLVLPSLHLRFLEKPFLFNEAPAFLAVLDFILPNESLRWMSKDSFIFAELADPNVFRVWGMMQVCMLLLDLPLPGRQRVDSPGRASGFLARYIGGSWSLPLLWCPLQCLLTSRLPRHNGARLRGLRNNVLLVLWGGQKGGVRRALLRWVWEGTVRLLHRHAFGRIGFTRKGKLSLGGGRLAGLLIQQTNIILCFGVGGKSCGIGNCGGDDSLIRLDSRFT